MKSRNVAILQSLIADYRVPFYLGLERLLSSRDIGLSVFAGAPPRGSFFRDGLGGLPFGTRLETQQVFGNTYWQGGASPFRGFDLVILSQEVRALTNYAVLLSRSLGKGPGGVALWGHGRNFQSAAGLSPTDGVRRLLNAGACRYFAYTELSREAFIARGAAVDRITVVNNSKETAGIAAARSSMSAGRRAAVRSGAGLDPDAHVAVFCSRLHDGKKIPFLVDAVRAARSRIGNLQLLVIGDGPLAGWLEDATRGDGWIRRVGARYGAEQADLLAASDIFLMPAHLGLSVLDAFAAGLPVLAAAFPNHSPEIAYLASGVNGLMLPAVAEDYASGIVHVLESPELHERMRVAAVASADRYSLCAMVEKFGAGVETALERPTAGICG